MKTNKAVKKEPNLTYENGKASTIDAFEQLKRSSMSCLLWEDEFYESGMKITDRIKELVKLCIDKDLIDSVVELIKQVKFDMKLRHCPLWMIVSVFNAGKSVNKNVIASVLTRPDDCGELISLYMLDGKKPLPNQMKKGIALALEKFDEYQLQKWNRDANYKLVDVVNLCHPKSTPAINKLINGTLPIADTWEVALSSAGKETSNKCDAWIHLLNENKLGDMAFLKNISNMDRVGVPKNIIIDRINNIKSNKLLPIDFIRSGYMNPSYENEIELVFLKSFNKDKIDGKTAILVDVSGSMDCGDCRGAFNSLMEYANSLAMIGRETYDDVDIYSFSNDVVKIPNRHGFALDDVIKNSQSHYSTLLWSAVEKVMNMNHYDRIIVITDEQAHDTPINCNIKHKYIINVAPYGDKGVGYEKGFIHINGISDKVFNYINEYEKVS